MKYLSLYIAVCWVLAGCGAARSTQSNQSVAKSASGHTPKFLDNISIDQESTTNSQKLAVYKAEKSFKTVVSGSSIEHSSSLQFKYAILMDVAVEDLEGNPALPFMEEWYGTPYRLGGTTKSGVDCSAFTVFFASSVYGISLPRTSREQHDATLPVQKGDLQEGDLVFFSSRKNRTITHVGVYMRNNKFVHASTSGGVMISDLDETYWKPRYVGAGRMNGLTSSK